MSFRRDTALDIVKGICVLVMIVHHALNYFPTDLVALKYFRFVSGAFLFLAGFVATHMYFTKYDLHTQRVFVGTRLLSRALKLIGIYVSANAVLALTIGSRLTDASHLTVPGYLKVWLFTGNYTTQSFSLLVPIAYTLVAVGMVILLFGGQRTLVVLAAAGFFLYCTYVYADQAAGYYLRYFAIGLAGAACGLLPASRLQKVLEPLGAITCIYALWLLVVAYLVRTTFLVYSVSVILNLTFLYALSMKVGADEVVARKVTLIGRYTLIGYLFQIVMLQLVKAALPGPVVAWWTRYNMPLSLLVTILAVWALAEGIDRLVQSHKFARRAYSLVFG